MDLNIMGSFLFYCSELIERERDINYNLLSSEFEMPTKLTFNMYFEA